MIEDLFTSERELRSVEIMVARDHLYAVNFYADARRKLIQPSASVLIFRPLSRLGDVSGDQDAMSGPASYIGDNLLRIVDQLLFHISMNVNPVIPFLAKVDVGNVNKNCRHMFPWFSDSEYVGLKF
ncbi:Uncharacterised protein [Bordetella ansorpii]|uniref:Uncharacterized protein n=1 Tax=Bordetella ansorpii TaxID=288768 RepID=A0A157SAS5_9BORD|nr:Uncharacterised protein [Bordetella ansorpii]